ncbi:MAG TPA: hypothetical protein VLE02_01355 [Nitrosarchaeum sp.]|nr:hypothetical protein [Nitrosarchaeum sp.]
MSKFTAKFCSPDDFYYTYSKTGKKLYYNKISGSRTAKSQICADFIPLIKENLDFSAEKLIEKREAYKKEIEELQQKIRDIDITLGGAKDAEQIREKKKKEEEDINRRRQKFEEDVRRENQRMLDELYHKNKKSSFLEDLHITTKLQWKEWLVKNHPDKGGKDAVLCQKVIEEGRKNGW